MRKLVTIDLRACN